jgi:hypothetical protein
MDSIRTGERLVIGKGIDNFGLQMGGLIPSTFEVVTSSFAVFDEAGTRVTEGLHVVIARICVQKSVWDNLAMWSKGRLQLILDYLRGCLVTDFAFVLAKLVDTSLRWSAYRKGGRGLRSGSA